jgi:preprotein translocase subunit SecA
VLVGTVSIEKTRAISGSCCKREGSSITVLNAKHHEREAEIVAQAGRHRAVTIATNMAGRGTDIVLGGNPELLVKHILDPEERERRLAEFRESCVEERERVLEAGGLHILGTERHESRRIDNQLRGRSGRQGDPGSSRFYLSLEDDLMRIFASDRVSAIMQRLGMEEGEPIEAGIVTRAIANAQKKVEERNFDVRKHLLEYDDVMNKQREVVYSMRRKILSGHGTKDMLLEYIEDLVEHVLELHIPPKAHPEDWNLEAITDALFQQFGARFEIDLGQLDHANEQALHTHVATMVLAQYAEREAEIGSELLRLVEQDILLRTIDSLWKDHLLSMDHLKEGIGLRAYRQVDPLREYQREGFEYFTALVRQVKADAVGILFRIHVEKPEDVARRQAQQARAPARITLTRGPAPQPAPAAPSQAASASAPQAGGGTGRGAPPAPPPKPATVRNDGPKVGRNDPCPCGSGQKYKKCHGK